MPSLEVLNVGLNSLLLEQGIEPRSLSPWINVITVKLLDKGRDSILSNHSWCAAHSAIYALRISTGLNLAGDASRRLSSLQILINFGVRCQTT